MAVWTEVLDTNFSYPNINIYQKLKDGVLSSYEARSGEGYVFYDTTENNTILLDPETAKETPVTYYYTIRIFPKIYNFDNFSLVAVRKEEYDKTLEESEV